MNDPVAGVVVGGATARPRAGRGWTLRRTLVTSLVLLFALVMLGTGLALSYLLERSLERELDARVVTTATRALDPGRIDPPPGGRDGPGRPLADMLVVVVDGQTIRTNTVVTRHGEQQGLTTQQVQALLSGDLGAHPTTVDLGEPLGPYRVVVATTRGGQHVITGLPLGPMLDSVRQMRLITTGLTLLGFVLVGVGTAWVVDRALRPLERVAGTASRVSDLPLSSGEVTVAERVPTRDTDPRTEVGQVGSALNGLLDHVESALRARHESESRLRRFVADASHELRTPLASVQGYTELSLREQDLPADVRHALTRVSAESTRMASLVEDLLLLARLDAGRPLERGPVDLTRLLLDTVSDARVAGPDHRWQLDLPEEAVEITGDSARLTQVVVNLLANARLHTPPGTTVVAGLRSTPDTVSLTVADDGPGIPPDLLPTIFERFSRGDGARTRTSGSTGLGLSIVDAVVSAHRGTIDVDSSPGGTRFTLTLPRHPSTGNDNGPGRE
ncbi:MAG: HAMP domain-containing sensor histidine kinase [Mobilicoccus sp.]|nr:HAMP domain-containing sensor histidine kinase [Mobilicoccus sp.]